jgi:hypothetical protein
VRIPVAPLSREAPKPDQNIWGASDHLTRADDICRLCGADLRVRRRLVDTVSPSAAARLALYEAAENLALGEEFGSFIGGDNLLWGSRAVAALIVLGYPSDVRERMRSYYLDAIDPIVYSYCGLAHVDLIGVAGDGTYLYRPFLCAAVTFTPSLTPLLNLN